MNATTDVEVNSNPNEYESQMVIPAGTVATGNTTDPYSMTCYAPAPRVINLFPKKNNASKTRGDGDDDYGYDDDDISHLGDDEGDEIGDVTVDLMDIYCTPHGAQFSKPIGINVNVGSDLEGETLILEDENGEEQETVVQSDGSVQFNVTHFSLKKLKAKIKSMRRSGGLQKALLKIETNIRIEPGDKHKVSYKKHLGMQQVNPKTENKKLAKIINKCGEKHQMKSVYRTISSETGCYADILIYQKYYKYTCKFNSKNYTFRYWKQTGRNLRTRPLSSGHSGGSGK
jgi:urease beta subunit